LRPRTRSRPKNFGLETGRYRNFGRQIRSIHDSGFPTEPKRLDLIPKPRPKFRLRANGYQISASRPADTEILASGLKSKSKLWPLDRAQRFDLETETETETELLRSGPRMRPKFLPLIAVRTETLSLRPEPRRAVWRPVWSAENSTYLWFLRTDAFRPKIKKFRLGDDSWNKIWTPDTRTRDFLLAFRLHLDAGHVPAQREGRRLSRRHRRESHADAHLRGRPLVRHKVSKHSHTSILCVSYVFISPPGCRAGLCSASVSYLFLVFTFNEFRQPNYLIIYGSDHREIFSVGRITAVGELPDDNFSIPQGTLPWQQLL